MSQPNTTHLKLDWTTHLGWPAKYYSLVSLVKCPLNLRQFFGADRATDFGRFFGRWFWEPQKCQTCTFIFAVLRILVLLLYFYYSTIILKMKVFPVDYLSFVNLTDPVPMSVLVHRVWEKYLFVQNIIIGLRLISLCSTIYPGIMWYWLNRGNLAEECLIIYQNVIFIKLNYLIWRIKDSYLK